MDIAGGASNPVAAAAAASAALPSRPKNPPRSIRCLLLCHLTESVKYGSPLLKKRNGAVSPGARTERRGGLPATARVGREGQHALTPTSANGLEFAVVTRARTTSAPKFGERRTIRAKVIALNARLWSGMGLPWQEQQAAQDARRAGCQASEPAQELAPRGIRCRLLGH